VPPVNGWYPLRSQLASSHSRPAVVTGRSRTI
jgi:hypothetical protein